MKLAITPVEHLILEGIMKLGNILFFPVDFILMNDFQIKNRDEYFSAIGIYKGFRIGILYDTFYDRFFPLLGRVYSMYNKTRNPYRLAKKIDKEDLLYNLVFGTRDDEIYLGCQVSLHKICDALFVDDLNESVMYLFDEIEALYSLEYNVKKTMKWIIPLIMGSRSGYDKVLGRL